MDACSRALAQVREPFPEGDTNLAATPESTSGPDTSPNAHLRAAGDRQALRRRHHDEGIHQRHRPSAIAERRIYDCLEQARLDALGCRWLPGVRGNLEGADTAGPLACWLLSEFGPGSAHSAPYGLASRSLDVLRTRLTDQEAFAAAAAQWARANTRRIPTGELQRLTPPADAADNAVATPGGDGAGAEGGDSVPAPAAGDGHSTCPVPLAKPPSAGGYHAFDTRHDRVIDAASLASPEEYDELRRCLSDELPAERALVRRLALRMQRALMASQERQWAFDREEGIIDGARLAAVVTSPRRARPFKEECEAPFPDTVVTLLVDCSSSMRGRPIRTAARVVDVVVQALERCGIACEVLGYTTRWWDGGPLHEAWQRAGSPHRPGRLNALEHVVIKGAGHPWRRCRRGLGLLLRRDFLKENVDGEALQWAHRRLLARAERRRVLMMICDGLPMDEATLQANPPDLLERHLQEVIETIERRSPVQLTAIGIGHDLSHHFRDAIAILDSDELAEALTGRLVAMLAPARGRPRGSVKRGG